jgi:hypothetical protein
MSSSSGAPPGSGTEGCVALYWIPLGAGGNGFVRFNGRIYESVKARFEHRSPRDLYHTALEVSVDGERFVIENAWPSPDADTESRGVAVEGPVFSKSLARFRPFRYEVRCWQDGVIADREEAVATPVLTHDSSQARRLLDLVADVPALTWGRDQLGAGDMWNSNSVIAWLLAKGGLLTHEVQPPSCGRAPGWIAGIRACA